MVRKYFKHGKEFQEVTVSDKEGKLTIIRLSCIVPESLGKPYKGHQKQHIDTNVINKPQWQVLHKLSCCCVYAQHAYACACTYDTLNSSTSVYPTSDYVQSRVARPPFCSSSATKKEAVSPQTVFCGGGAGTKWRSRLCTYTLSPTSIYIYIHIYIQQLRTCMQYYSVLLCSLTMQLDTHITQYWWSARFQYLIYTLHTQLQTTCHLYFHY